MNTKLTKLRDACTDKQIKFCQLLFSGIIRPEAYIKAGYKPKNHRQAIVSASKLCTTNKNVMAYYAALKDNQDRNSNISRTMQLNRLDKVFDLAVSQESPSAMVSAIREQNEMLGFHRELAPNKEREQARHDLLSTEVKEIMKLVRSRTAALSLSPVASCKTKQVTSSDITDDGLKENNVEGVPIGEGGTVRVSNIRERE